MPFGKAFYNDDDDDVGDENDMIMTTIINVFSSKAFFIQHALFEIIRIM